MVDTSLTQSLRAVGQPMSRREDLRLLTGQGRFTDDFAMAGQLYAALVRSPHPHARIVHVDLEAARVLPGIRGVYSGADCRADGLKPLPHSPVPSTRYDLKLKPPPGTSLFIGPHDLLPVDRVRFVGEAVALVVAESKAQALDAAEAVMIDYEDLPWVANPMDACAAGAPAVWDEVPDNVLIDTTFGDVEATDRAFAAADHVVKMHHHIGNPDNLILNPSLDRTANIMRLIQRRLLIQ